MPTKHGDDSPRFFLTRVFDKQFFYILSKRNREMQLSGKAKDIPGWLREPRLHVQGLLHPLPWQSGALAGAAGLVWECLSFAPGSDCPVVQGLLRILSECNSKQPIPSEKLKYT